MYYNPVLLQLVNKICFKLSGTGMLWPHLIFFYMGANSFIFVKMYLCIYLFK